MIPRFRAFIRRLVWRVYHERGCAWSCITARGKACECPCRGNNHAKGTIRTF